ncbi:two-component sensor histidine kinase [Massilia sp. CFBP 13647]|nr:MULTISPECIES: ATP-binding protein [unclassified Massilia]MBD8528849.1 two-component sensor histidine kinase [Massilia sp. CFBP 13647]MBD8673491.1 two-component sensor histidine kinase [Massilia sp. CFBP 13721]
MHAAPAEVFLIDPATLALVDVNPSARANLGYDDAALTTMCATDIAPSLDEATLRTLVASLDVDITEQRCLRTELHRADGSSYPVKLTFLLIRQDGRALLLAVGDDLSLELAASNALAQYQSRFNAIVNHTPGLVYQFVLGADGRHSYPYLSDGCAPLLGVQPGELQRDPDLFLRLLLPEDRKGYLEAMAVSKIALSGWNWEGRIWIDAWKDVKWINLRATPHAAAAGAVQWDGIMTNITDSKIEQQDALRSRARLAELTDHIEQVKEQERARIAREIHDDLGGNLTAIKMALSMLAARLPPEQPALLEKASYLDDLVDRTIDAVHRISLDLRPSTLDLGIVAALEWQAREFEKGSGIACVFRSAERAPVLERELDPDHAAALFRVFQEALTNVAKHAGATRVTVTLRRQRQHLTLAICDNGRGIAPADRLKPASFGLRGMSERARALGGTLTLSAAPGGGTMVTIKIRLAPLTAARSENA